MFRAMPIMAIGMGAVLALGSCGPLALDRDPRDGQGAHTYRSTLGNATLADMNRLLPRLLGRYGYHLERGSQTPRQISLETRWRQRRPLEDEVALGVAAARTRLILHGTRRDERLYNLNFQAENLVRYEGTDEWKRAPVTDMFRSYADDIATELAVSLTSGVRRY